jgi:hypothetical protein
MKKRNIAVLAISALTAGMLVAVVLPATGQVTGKTFTLCEKDSRDYEAEVDNGSDSFSAGDVFIFAEPEFNTDGERVGKTFGQTTVLKRLKRDAYSQFNVSIHLRGGDLEIQSAGKFSQLGGGHPLAIVGGTGKYNDATGVVKIYGQGCDGVKGSTDHLKIVLN